MITRLRSLYNSIDKIFDLSAISENRHFSREIAGEGQARTARQALESVLPVAKDFDRKALLKLIVSQQGVDQHGAGVHWEFFFDLVDRRAQLLCEWILTQDEKTDSHGSTRIEITARPFPPADSPLRQLVRDGHLLHRQLAGMWMAELNRLPALPHQFRDTNAIIADFVKQGLDTTQTEFSMRTGQSPEGNICWMVQTRHKTYYAAFTKGNSGAD